LNGMFDLNTNYIKMKTVEKIKPIEVLKKNDRIDPMPEKRVVERMEQIIKKILVPVDFSKTSDFASFGAAAMANVLNCELYLIHVIDYKDVNFTIVPESKDSRLPIADVELKAYEKLNELRLLIEDKSGIKCRIYVTEGSIEGEIIKFAKQKMADLIIMGTHGVSGYKEVLLGSNAQRVVSHSDVPVLTMKKDDSYSEFKNILLPIDDSPHSREKVNIAAEIAEIYGSNIHLLGLPGSKDIAELRAMKIKLESVEKILSRNEIPFKSEIILDESYLAQAALDYASKYKCDLIVINAGSESKLGGGLPGPFTHQIVNHSKVPVLSVKPTEDSLFISAPGFGIS
jgi:nucleotide-binding universal stress UspA family protein